MNRALDTCPQCGEHDPEIHQYELVFADDGEPAFTTYYFACCGEQVTAWGYSDEWAEQRMAEQGSRHEP